MSKLGLKTDTDLSPQNEFKGAYKLNRSAAQNNSDVQIHQTINAIVKQLQFSISFWKYNSNYLYTARNMILISNE